MLSLHGALAGLLVVATAAGAQAQSLAEVARKEKERRAKLSGTRPATPITEEDLATGGGGAGTVSNPGSTEPAAPPAAGGSSGRMVGAVPDARSTAGSSRSSGSGEAYWRGRAAQARAAVSSAEARVRSLETRAAQVGPSTPGPRAAPCQAGTIVRRGMSANELRERSAGQKHCDGEALHAQERDRVHADLAQARAELDRARRTLDALDEEARRGGALPGWLR